MLDVPAAADPVSHALAVWRPAVLQRLPLAQLQEELRRRVRREERQGHDGGHRWLVRLRLPLCTALLVACAQLTPPRDPPSLCSLTGIGEIVLLPLDVLKIKRQCVDPSSLSSRAPARTADPLTRPPRRAGPTRRRSARAALPRSSATRASRCTAARRGPRRATPPARSPCVPPLSLSLCPESETDPFALALALQLFGGSAFTKEYVFKLEDYRTATWYQNFIASIAGSVRPFPLSLARLSLTRADLARKIGRASCRERV